MSDQASNEKNSPPPGTGAHGDTRASAHPQEHSGEPAPATDEPDAQGAGPKIVISSDEGVAMADPDGDPTQGVPDPAKVMRIGTMVKQLLEEVKTAPLDEAARDHLADLHARSVQELRGALSDELAEEIDRMALPLSQTPSEAELRVAQAQLVGWLEGLFHGIQTALVAQQMLAQNQLKSMRKQLPPGLVPPQAAAPGSGGSPGEERRPGQYL